MTRMIKIFVNFNFFIDVFLSEKFEISAKKWLRSHAVSQECASRRDVTRFAPMFKMEESTLKPTKRGGKFCVAGAPGKQSCQNTSYTPGISMHYFPSDPSTREKWVKFVQRHRVDFVEAKKHSVLCSAHFEESCFSRQLAAPGQGLGKTILVKGSVPTRHTMAPVEAGDLSKRERRQVSITVYISLDFRV